MEDLDLIKVTGIWYEIQKSEKLFTGGRCSAVQYSLSSPTTFDVIFEYYIGRMVKQVIAKTASIDPDSKSTWIFESMPDPRIPKGNATRSYSYFLDSDYYNFASIFACTDAGTDKELHLSWIIGRNRSLSNEYLEKAIQSFKNQHLETDSLRIVDQVNCI